MAQFTTGKPAGPSGFAQQLIAALEDAEKAAQQPKPASQLAQAAWDKLQFDFPVVSQGELASLVQEYADGNRQDISSSFLSVLRENAAAVAPSDALATSSSSAPAAGSEAASGSSSAGLVPLYQQLYAVAVVQGLRRCLEAPEAAAGAQLAGMQAGVSVLKAEGSSRMEEAPSEEEGAAGAAAAEVELEHRLSQQEDEDSMAYEPIEPLVKQRQQPPRLPPPPAAAIKPAAGAAGLGAAAAAPLADQLAELAGHLSYHCMSDTTAWRQHRLMARVAACLAAARRHARLSELQGATHLLLRLATDRMAAVPLEMEAGLPALLDALGIPGGNSAEPAAAAAAAGELALAAAVSLAGQLTAPSARRRLWQEVHQRLLPVAAQQLEQQQVLLARQARAAAAAAAAAATGSAATAVMLSPQQQYSIMLPCQLLYFYVLQAPPAAGSSSSSQLQEALLRGGLLRSLVLLFVQLGGQPGAEPLRCALLLACAAAQPLVDWAAAVPGFKAAAAAAPALQPGGDAQLHGALWQVLLTGGGSQLATLLADATPAAKVPGVYLALQLMSDLQAVSRQAQPLWGARLDAALRQLAATLRQQYSKPQAESDTVGAAAGAAEGRGEAGTRHTDSDSDSEGVAAAEDEHDAKKLGIAAAEQQEVLAARRAQQLQPACLKLIKDLLQRQAGSSKHD